MSIVKTFGNVIKQEEIATDIYSLEIETDIALEAKAGQFVSMFCHSDSKLLPRPISICFVDKVAMSIRVVYRIAGKGTAEFSIYRSGDKVEIMGPLGNGFPINEINPMDKVTLVGGGIGVPPMVQCAYELKALGIRTTAVMGYRDSETFLQDELSSLCKSYVATEDGSVGTRGNVINALNAKRIKSDVILACGPRPMLKGIKEYARVKGITCYISMEERMACGIGACLGCVCKSSEIDDHSNVKNKRVCKDGPVFLAEDIIL